MRPAGRLIGAAAALALCLAQGTAHGIVVRADRSDSQYIALGASSTYASVGQFGGSTGTQSFLASGTLIAPDWVLTAAHVVDDANQLTFTVGGKNYAADGWIADPYWKGDLMAGYDIGLVHLKTAVADVLPAVRYHGAAELNKVGTAVGYGKTGNGDTGGTKLDGNKRAARNAIDQLPNPRLFLSDFDNPRSPATNRTGPAKPLALEGLVAPGDSGGGVFIDTPTGTYLAGVNSFAGAYDGQVNSGYGDTSGHTRVSAFNRWIDSVLSGGVPLSDPQTVGTPSGAVKYPLPENVPEPGTWGLLLAGGLALWLGRRFRRRA